MENQENIYIEINKDDAGGLKSTLMEMSNATCIYELSEIVKSVNNAFTGDYVNDAEKLKAVANFNNFMATIAASNEWINLLYDEISKHVANGNKL